MARWSASISSRDACMKSTSSGSGLRSVRAIASTPRSATRRRRISASTSSLQVPQAGLELLLGEALGELAVADLAALARLAHHPGGQALEVELPQRAVEVVGAADGPSGLHAREAVHGHTGELAQLLAVHVHQRLEEHLRQLLR